MSQRTEQVGSLIHKALGMIFARDIELPEGALVTVTRVEVQPDLKHARVFLMVTPEDQSEQVLSVVRSQHKHIQQEVVAEHMTMKFSPRLSFTLDVQEQHASHIENLLDSIAHEQESDTDLKS